MTAPVTSKHGLVDTGGHAPRRIRARSGRGDRVFLGFSRTTACTVLAIFGSIGAFLTFRGWQALAVAKFSFLTTAAWQPDSHHFGVAGVMSGTVLIALVALVISFPMAVGTALFITELAPARVRQWLISGVDLMAAVPSVVFGLWGFAFMQGRLLGVARWLSTWFGWIPVFKVTLGHQAGSLPSPTIYTASIFVVGVVVSFMSLPIQCAIVRETFSQAPVGEREGALALGATRWGVITSVVLPFGKGGIIGGTMLGLGRSLGETIAVYLIISPVFTINWHILQTGGDSISSLIAQQAGDASGFGMAALMAAGLALFALTLVINFTASTIVNRSRSGALSEA